MPPEQEAVAVVTGGGQGIGRAFCHALGESGAAVAVLDVDGALAQRVADEIAAAGGRVAPVQADVSDRASVVAAVHSVEQSLGRPTILVNNAAIASTLGERRPFTEIALDAWNHVIAVNVTGVFNCCAAVAPGMKENGYGKIVNISSNTIFRGVPGILHYVTSKAALIGMTRSLASELGSFGIRVNAITAGSTHTETRQRDAEELARKAAATSLGRMQTPADLVGTMLFLASPASDFVTGQTINVDGGVAFH